MRAKRLTRFQALLARIKINSTRVRSARAQSQQCTIAAGKYGHSRVSFGTAHTR